MSLPGRFIDHIKNENLFQQKDNLLLAVSGGVDSVVLCELCRQAGFHFEIAHCNFQLRGQESERDEAFVRSLGLKYETRVFVKKFNTEKYAAENKFSIQVAARTLRYKWFDELIASTSNLQPSTFNLEPPTFNLEPSTSNLEPSTLNLQPSTSNLEPSTLNLQPSTLNLEPSTFNLQPSTFLLTAHHANDNIETLLMNFFKGTGIKGLLGILPKQGKIRHPLLFATKEEIIAFAKESNLSFAEDSSNSSDKYTRNYFRNQLIPSLQKVFSQVEENLLDNIERFKDMDVLYRQGIQLHKKKLVEYKGNEIHIPVLKLQKAEPLKTIIYEIIKDYGFTAHQTDEVLHLLKSESGKYISSATHKIIKNRKWMIIASHNTREASLVVIHEKDKEIEFETGKLKIEKYPDANRPLLPGDHTAALDMNKVTFPLLLRKWKQGDYFYPLGMQKKKKLSRFFIDQKMSLTEKEKAWVIESDKRIIWIVGKRIDDRFKITDRTSNVMAILFREL